MCVYIRICVFVLVYVIRSILYLAEVIEMI